MTVIEAFDLIQPRVDPIIQCPEFHQHQGTSHRHRDRVATRVAAISFPEVVDGQVVFQKGWSGFQSAPSKSNDDSVWGFVSSLATASAGVGFIAPVLFERGQCSEPYRGVHTPIRISALIYELSAQVVRAYLLIRKKPSPRAANLLILQESQQRWHPVFPVVVSEPR